MEESINKDIRREYVAADPWTHCNRTSLEYETSIDNVNNKVLPLLRSLGYPAPESIEELTNLSGRTVLRSLMSGAMKEVKFDYDYERAEYESCKHREICEKLNSVMWPRSFPRKYYESTHFDKEKGCFVLDKKELNAVYASDPAALEVLDKVKELVTLINSFKGNSTVNLSHILRNFDRLTGKTAICPEILTGCWTEFVRLQNTQK